MTTNARPGSETAAKTTAQAAPSIHETPTEPIETRNAASVKISDRPEALPGTTYKLKWPSSAHAMYVTINDTIENGQRRPFEIFINSKNMERYAWTLALTRMISAVFRKGGDVGFVVDELKAIFDPRGGQWIAGRYVPSILAAIGDVIDLHLANLAAASQAEEVCDE